MTKKILFVLLMFLLLAGGVFAKDPKHQGGDLLIGIDIGAGFSPNIFKLTKDEIPAADYALAFEAGMNIDYYFFKYLSLSSGVFFRPGIYVLLDKELTEYDLDTAKVTDWAKTPICLTIPIMAHFNIPYVDFLYLGAGINLNIPVGSMLSSELPDIDTKGEFFIGIPIDFGFDFIKAGKGGGRLFFRMTPEFHKGGGKPVIFSLMWQIYNFKVR